MGPPEIQKLKFNSEAENIKISFEKLLPRDHTLINNIFFQILTFVNHGSDFTGHVWAQMTSIFGDMVKLTIMVKSLFYFFGDLYEFDL